jgi:DNA-binding PucR family transcriptional regulator
MTLRRCARARSFLRRFEALTDRSLANHETTVELWWALQARQLTQT